MLLYEMEIFYENKKLSTIFNCYFFIGIVFTGMYSYKYINENIPDEINVFSIEDISRNPNLCS